MKKFLFAILLSSMIYHLSSAAILAQQYGSPAPSQTILIDKMVARTPSDNNCGNASYVDNFAISDQRFHAAEFICFRLRVRNTSTVRLNGVTVKDFVPSYLTPIDGPGGFDTANRTISFNAGDFNPDEEKVYYFRMQVYALASLPADRGLFCLNNIGQAYNSVAFDDDTAQFCIEKQVTGVTQVPQAGPEMGIVLLGGETIMIGVGLMLKRKAR